MKLKIVSGGQTGVDQGALEAAVTLGLAFGGWAPHGWLAERWPKDDFRPGNGSIPEEFRAGMQEFEDRGSNANNYRARTKANIRDSDATLILADKLPLGGGTKLTNDHALALRRPHHVVDLSSPNAEDDARKWLSGFNAQSLVLNVAGPRESKCPGIQAKTKSFLCEILRAVF